VDNRAEEDRERDGSTSSSTTWRTSSSMWRMPRIELNGEGEPVWLTPYLRDPQPEGERDSLVVMFFMPTFLLFVAPVLTALTATVCMLKML